MLAIEKRWATSILEAFAPSGPTDGLAPDPGEVDYARTIGAMARAASARAALGLRLAIFLVALAPIWLWGRLTIAPRLAIDERTELLRELLAHPSFVVRELTTLLKLAAAFALLGTSTVRARSGYDRVRTDLLPRYAPMEQSGERVRIRFLPVLAEAEADRDDDDDEGERVA